MPHTKINSRYISTLRIAGDLLTANIAFVCMWLVWRNDLLNNRYSDFIVLLLFMNVALTVSIVLVKLNIGQNILFADEIIRRTFYQVLISLVVFFAALAASQVVDLSRMFILQYFGTLFAVVSVWRIAFRFSLRRYRRAGMNYKKVCILGTGNNAMALYKEMTGDSGYGYKVLGFFDSRNRQSHKEGNLTVLGFLEDVVSYLDGNSVDEVYCAYPDKDKRTIREIIECCESRMIRFYTVPTFRSIVNRQYEFDNVGVVPVLSLHSEPLQMWHNRAVKRVFDILFSIWALLFVFVPAFILMAPIIKLSSPGPVLFKQRRNGENGKEFWCYKFRSMVLNKDSEKLATTRNDPRKTWIGNIIRKTSIDELPQFWNVLRGEMSVVGPRPHMLEHTRIYKDLTSKYMLRHLVKPGITGWAQIHGLRGEIQSTDFMRRRVEADVWYIEHWTFFLDIKIIYKTFIDAIHIDKHAI